jgi:hypothetical protein
MSPRDGMTAAIAHVNVGRLPARNLDDLGATGFELIAPAGILKDREKAPSTNFEVTVTPVPVRTSRVSASIATLDGR